MLPVVVTLIRVIWRVTRAEYRCSLLLCLDFPIGDDGTVFSVELYTLLIRALVVVNTAFFGAILWQLCLKLRADLDRHM